MKSHSVRLAKPKFRIFVQRTAWRVDGMRSNRLKVFVSAMFDSVCIHYIRIIWEFVCEAQHFHHRSIKRISRARTTGQRGGGQNWSVYVTPNTVNFFVGGWDCLPHLNSKYHILKWVNGLRADLIANRCWIVVFFRDAAKKKWDSLPYIAANSANIGCNLFAQLENHKIIPSISLFLSIFFISKF